MKEANSVYPGDKFRFLGNILEKQIGLQISLDNRANGLLSISGALLVFTVSQLRQFDEFRLATIILALTLIVTIILALLALKPPKNFTKHGQEETVFYHSAIKKSSQDSYVNNLGRLVDSEKDIVNEYAREIYNLTSFSIVYKKFYYNSALAVFSWGILIAIIIGGLVYSSKYL